MKATISTVLIAAALLHVGAALAATPDRPVRLEVETGALVGGSDLVVHTNLRPGKVRTTAGPAVGIGGGYAITDHLELGGTAQAAAGLGFGTDVGYFSVTAGPRYYPLGRHQIVSPWLTGEFGWYRGRVALTPLFGPTSTRTDDGAGLNAGGGLDVPLGSLVSLGLDLRYHRTFNVLDDPSFVTAMVNVGFHFGH